ncbi:MAG: STAS domain-containing protein [Acidimicrobiales bacterium]
MNASTPALPHRARLPQDLTYIDSSGINVLIRAWGRVRDRTAMPIVVRSLQPRVLRVLETCGITELNIIE